MDFEKLWQKWPSWHRQNFILPAQKTEKYESMHDLTQQDILAAHAEHGALDWHLVKMAMGANWPAEWEALGPGEAIFAPDEDRS